MASQGKICQISKNNVICNYDYVCVIANTQCVRQENRGFDTVTHASERHCEVTANHTMTKPTQNTSAS